MQEWLASNARQPSATAALAAVSLWQSRQYRDSEQLPPGFPVPELVAVRPGHVEDRVAPHADVRCPVRNQSGSFQPQWKAAFRAEGLRSGAVYYDPDVRTWSKRLQCRNQSFGHFAVSHNMGQRRSTNRRGISD